MQNKYRGKDGQGIASDSSGESGLDDLLKKNAETVGGGEGDDVFGEAQNMVDNVHNTVGGSD